MKLLILTLQSRVSFRLHLLVKCSPPICIFLISYMSPCVLLSSWNMIRPYQIYFHHPYVYCLLQSPVSYTDCAYGLIQITNSTSPIWFPASILYDTLFTSTFEYIYNFSGMAFFPPGLILSIIPASCLLLPAFVPALTSALLPVKFSYWLKVQNYNCNDSF